MDNLDLILDELEMERGDTMQSPERLTVDEVERIAQGGSYNV